MDTLAFGYILPTTGRIRDFNPLETCAARRTFTEQPVLVSQGGLFFEVFSLEQSFGENTRTFSLELLLVATANASPAPETQHRWPCEDGAGLSRS